MTKQSSKINTIKTKKSNIFIVTKEKINNYMEMINNTIISSQKYKVLDIVTANELNVCIKNLQEVFSILSGLKDALENTSNLDDIISKLQNINNELSSIFRIYGTLNLLDLLNVCFGVTYIKSQINDVNLQKWELLSKYVHPISYKILNWKTDNEYSSNKTQNKETAILSKNKIVEDFTILEISKTFDCFDLARTSQNFQTKVYGIKISFQNVLLKQTLIVSGVVDDLYLDCFEHEYLNTKIKHIKENVPNDPLFLTEEFNRFIKSLMMKEILIYSNDELYSKFIGYNNQTNLIKQKPISQVVKEFLNGDLFYQRIILIQLLLKYSDPEFQYLAYLLYDLLSSDNNGSIDTIEQTILYDSLPWNIKKYFKDAMKTTIQYTNTLSNFDNNKIPLEQQICLMKASENVKEKAMIKLKEVNAKSDDSGSKARQFLEGLLKIPFGIYKNEEILTLFKTLHDDFKNIFSNISKLLPDVINLKKSYTLNEINNKVKVIEKSYLRQIEDEFISELCTLFTNGKRESLIINIHNINIIIKTNKLAYQRLLHSGKKTDYIKSHIKKFIMFHKEDEFIIIKLLECFKNHNLEIIPFTLKNDFKNIRENGKILKNKFNGITDILDDSVYGHKNAKRQIERIIGQWVTGEQTGYCFGFEGPPGLGKTSLAKRGIANCLKDKDGNQRPFTFIAIGGSSNGSVLDGHNYTYVGSTWGKIVDTLIETKCMNPIIFIDELDKVSRTEHGKEIIGILTHLVDTTQNSAFQDKYFSGVDLDLSKILFIFSYNDVAAIDRILLDRIHRIKFDPLTTEEKLTICKKFLLKDVYKKMRLGESIKFTDEILKFIIDTYTNESGVRKLKEILFEVVSEINLTLLNNDDEIELPIIVTEDMLKYNYLKERNEVRYITIPKDNQIGIINGLWANYYGMGGIIPIEISFFPTTSFLDLKLTGMQGDVMKESMNVAKTIAWKLTTSSRRENLIKIFEKTRMQGIHIHCPEGATPKDGPSAGGAITSALYSLFNDKKINRKIAMTGEINMQGNITAIGGLELKIKGGIRGGVTTFIYPEENHKDFIKFKERYEYIEKLDKIEFFEVSNIKDIIKIVFDRDKK